MAKALNFERAIVSINNFNSNCLRGLEHSYERLKASASSYLQLPNVGNRNQHFLRAASSAPTSAINHRPQTLASIDPFEPFSLSPSFVVLSRKTSHSPLTKIWNLWLSSGIGPLPSFSFRFTSTPARGWFCARRLVGRLLSERLCCLLFDSSVVTPDLVSRFDPITISNAATLKQSQA